MEDLRRLNLVLPGLIDQAIRLAEHTPLPIESTSQLVYTISARHGHVPDVMYEAAIATASNISVTGNTLEDAMTILRVALANADAAK